jgi:mycothiol synthase
VINAAERLDRLNSDQVSAVLELARSAGDTDGAFPLSEHTVLHLRHGGDAPSVHLVLRDPGGELTGYAHVDVTDPVDGASAEVVVHPLRRRHGLGRMLVLGALNAAQQADPNGRLRLWAHGDHPSASALALSLGFDRARVLWQLRRSLFAEVPEPKLPDGVRLRPFQPGADERAWLAVNARAFASHPEQGRWTMRDLRARMAESWFDPAGFLLAERDGELVGFHWTKVHGEIRGHHHHDAVDGPPHQHDPLGEVYVLGVDPDAHGLGLGRALTAAGLRYLRSRGLDQVMLYVEESNQAAVGLYHRLGFARWSTDVQYLHSLAGQGRFSA